MTCHIHDDSNDNHYDGLDLIIMYYGAYDKYVDDCCLLDPYRDLPV